LCLSAVNFILTLTQIKGIFNGPFLFTRTVL
jgi:hypothetical protein